MDNLIDRAALTYEEKRWEAWESQRPDQQHLPYVDRRYLDQADTDSLTKAATKKAIRTTLEAVEAIVQPVLESDYGRWSQELADNLVNLRNEFARLQAEVQEEK